MHFGRFGKRPALDFVPEGKQKLAGGEVNPKPPESRKNMDTPEGLLKTRARDFLRPSEVEIHCLCGIRWVSPLRRTSPPANFHGASGVKSA